MLFNEIIRERKTCNERKKLMTISSFTREIKSMLFSLTEIFMTKDLISFFRWALRVYASWRRCVTFTYKHTDTPMKFPFVERKALKLKADDNVPTTTRHSVRCRFHCLFLLCSTELNECACMLKWVEIAYSCNERTENDLDATISQINTFK